MSESFIRHEHSKIVFSDNNLVFSSGIIDPAVYPAGNDGDIYAYNGVGALPKGLYIYKTVDTAWRSIPNITDITVNVGEIIAKPVSMAASTTNLVATYNNGTAGVGATLTNNATQAALMIDSYTVQLNDRLLIKDQTDQTQNGIYVTTDVGSVSTDWILTRAADFNTPELAANGAFVFIDNGTVNGGTGWVFVFPTGTVTFGTSNIIWNKFTSAGGAYTAGTGITVTGGSISANFDNVTIGVSSNQLIVRSTSTANQVLLSSGVSGNAAAWSNFTNAAHGGLSGQTSGGNAASGLDLHALATSSLSGFMAASDKTKLTDGPILLLNGAAGSPAYSFSSSSGNGMYLKATNDLGFSANSTLLLELNATTSSPYINLFAPTFQDDGDFSTVGDARAGQYVLRNSTSNATPTQVYIDGATKQITLNSINSTIFSFEVFVTAIQTASPFATMGWKLSGGIRQNGSAALTSIIGTVSKDILFDSSGGTLTWDVSTTADTGTGALVINITGAAATSIKWLARARTVETKV